MTTDETVIAKRPRGRPQGRSPQGLETERRLYDTAIGLFTDRGFEQTTLRDIARAAGVSVGLLYRYFPNKRALVLALYVQLTKDFVDQALLMEPGRWRDRFGFALRTSLEVLAPHRDSLAALTPVLLGESDTAVLGSGSRFSRDLVQLVFETAVEDARDAPKAAVAQALGRLLYVTHLLVILWWLLDKSPEQRSTTMLVEKLESLASWVALSLRLPGAKGFLLSVDVLVRQGLLGETLAAGHEA